MDLSFSSEREDYGDADPTRGAPSSPPPAAAVAVSTRKSTPPRQAQKPLAQNGWATAASTSNAVAVAAPKRELAEVNPKRSSGGRGFLAALTGKTPLPSLSKAAAAAASSKPAASADGAVEEIQSFDPNDMGASVSRRSASASRSRSSKRRRGKAAKAREAEERRKRLENAAPGAIDDDLSPRRLGAGGSGGGGGLGAGREAAGGGEQRGDRAAVGRADRRLARQTGPVLSLIHI